MLFNTKFNCKIEFDFFSSLFSFHSSLEIIVLFHLHYTGMNL